LAHVAFRVEELADLLSFYHRIKEQGLSTRSVNHGNSLAFYFEDPEGNRIEIYWSTHLRIHQPFVRPIDLDLPEAELLRQVQWVAEQFTNPLSHHQTGESPQS
jgi:catechol-2,3-dioxygenase